MIKIFVKGSDANKHPKVVNQVAKKLKLNNEEKEKILFSMSEKFLFSFIFVFVVKGKDVLLYGASEDGKSDNKINTIPLAKIKKFEVVKKTDFNVVLTNGTSINLTSAVGVKPSVQRTVSLSNKVIDAIKANYRL